MNFFFGDNVVDQESIFQCKSCRDIGGMFDDCISHVEDTSRNFISSIPSCTSCGDEWTEGLSDRVKSSDKFTACFSCHKCYGEMMEKVTGILSKVTKCGNNNLSSGRKDERQFVDLQAIAATATPAGLSKSGGAGKRVSYIGDKALDEILSH